jgi:hypothetical protein
MHTDVGPAFELLPQWSMISPQVTDLITITQRMARAISNSARGITATSRAPNPALKRSVIIK